MEAIAINDNTWYFSGAVGRAFLFRGSQAALLVDTTNGPGNLREIITKLVGDIPVILLEYTTLVPFDIIDLQSSTS